MVAAARLRCFDSTGTTPIFMFHRINPLPAAANWPQLYVAPNTFVTELSKLKRARARCLNLDDILKPPQPQNKGFALTFDDGFVSALLHAGPFLAGLGFRAINFLVADRLGMRNEWDAGVDNTMEPLMDVSQVRDWLGLGHDLGGHTLTHPHLDQIPLAQAREEIFAGKKKLEDTFGREIRHFAYPYGGLTPAVTELVREAGFATACTTVTDLAGSEAHPLRLPRLNVDRDLLDATRLAAQVLSRTRRRLRRNN